MIYYILILIYLINEITSNDILEGDLNGSLGACKKTIKLPEKRNML